MSHRVVGKVKGVRTVWQRAGKPSMLWLSDLVGASVKGPDGEHLGHLRDLGLERTRSGPVVQVVLVDGGGRCFELPADAVTRWQRHQLQVRPPLQVSGRTRSPGEHVREWLAKAVVGKPMLTKAAQARARRVCDLGLLRLPDGRWIVQLIDTRPIWQRRCGLPRRTTPWSISTRRCPPEHIPSPAPQLSRACPRDTSKGTRHVDLPR